MKVLTREEKYFTKKFKKRKHYELSAYKDFLNKLLYEFYKRYNVNFRTSQGELLKDKYNYIIEKLAKLYDYVHHHGAFFEKHQDKKILLEKIDAFRHFENGGHLEKINKKELIKFKLLVQNTLKEFKPKYMKNKNKMITKKALTTACKSIDSLEFEINEIQIRLEDNVGNYSGEKKFKWERELEAEIKVLENLVKNIKTKAVKNHGFAKVHEFMQEHKIILEDEFKIQKEKNEKN